MSRPRKPLNALNSYQIYLRVVHKEIELVEPSLVFIHLLGVTDPKETLLLLRFDRI